MDKTQIAELIYKFVTDVESSYSYETYLNETIQLLNVNKSKEEKDTSLREYINKFIEENRPAPKHFYLKLKDKDELLQYETSPNNGDCCCEVEYQLTEYGEAVWEAESLENAVWVKYNSTEWYNADYETPNHCYTSDQLDVVDEYGTIYDDKPMSDLEYASLYYKVYGDDSYLNRLQRRIKEEPEYNPEESYNNIWYSIKCLKDAERMKNEKNR